MTTETLSPPGGRRTLPVLPTAVLLGLLALVLLFQVQPLLAAAAAVAVVAVALAWLRPFWLFTAVMAFVPLYDGLLRVVTWQWRWPDQYIRLLSLWKEAAILLLFAALVLQHLTGRRRLVWRLYQFDLWLLAVVVLAAAYIPVATRLGIGVYGLRNYLVPLSLFFLARLLAPSRRELTFALALWTAVAAGVAAFGIYQARFIDFPTMVRMGYVDENGALPFAFKTALRDGVPIPRAISTATGPNQLALYLNFFILLCLMAFVRWRSPLRRALLAGLLALFTACLLLTFSRGGFLALMVSLAAWVGIWVAERGVRRTLAELLGNRLALVGLVGAAALLAWGLVVSGFVTRVVRGLTGRDPAADAHVNSMAYSLGFLTQHPMGIGMGMVGERALKFSGEAPIQHTESTYFQFGMETGLFGMALLLVALTSLMLTLWRMRSRGRADGRLWALFLAELALVYWAGALVDFIVTPLLQNLLAAGYLWTAAGLAFAQDAKRSE